MSQFSVKPAALEAYAALLGSAGGPAGKTLDYQYLIPYANYVEANVTIEGGGFIFDLIRGKIENLRVKLGIDASLISTNLIESAMGLQSAAQDYRTTDHSQAEHLDGVYHAPTKVGLDGTATNTPITDPQARLTAPSDDLVVPDLAQELLDGAGVFSESDLILKIMRWCGLDVVGWVTDKLAGDQKSLARCKSALENLSDFGTDAGNDVTAGAATMLKDWTGNAADAAETAFSKTATALTDYAGQIEAAASRISALLVGMQEGTSALEGALTTALDAAAEAAIAVAAAGCLEEVPGIDVVADIIGAGEVYKVTHAVKEFFDIWNMVWAGNEGVVGLITGLEGGFSSYDVNGQLPTVGYYNGSQGSAPNYTEPTPRHGGAY